MTHILPEGHNRAITGTEQTLEFEQVPPEDTVEGTPSQGAVTLGTISDIEVGIWELRQGVVTDTEVEEFFVVLSGEARIEFLGHNDEVTDTAEVRAGDVMRLAAGSRTRWTVTDHIRKVYISE